MSCFYFCFFLLIFVFKVLGYPRGWTKIEGMSDENRAKVLQSELKKDTIHIDDIFNKYLGTDRLGNLV